MRCSRCCARVAICSCRDGRALGAGDGLGREGAAIWGADGLAMAGRCGSVAGPRWISGRGAAICGAAGRGGAAKCGAGRGAMAGCCGGVARNAGAADRAIAGGGAGRAMAGGAAGRAMAARWCRRSGRRRTRPKPSLLGGRADACRDCGDTKKKRCKGNAARKHHRSSPVVLVALQLSTRSRKDRSPGSDCGCCDFAPQG